VVGLPFSGGDAVDVDVEDAVDDELQIIETGLLAPLAQRRHQRRLVALGMAAHLQPAAEAAVVMEEESVPVEVDDEAAGGDVSRREVAAGKGIGRSGQQVDHVVAMPPLQRIGRVVSLELREEIGVSPHDGYHR